MNFFELEHIEFLLFFGIAGVVIFSIGYMFYLEKKRSDALQMLAQRIGFNYVLRDDSFRNSHTHLKMFSRGRSHRTNNVMQGEREGVRVMMGDYHYTTGSGKNSHHHNQTMCVITDPSMALPNFFLRRENSLLDYLGKLFGGQDINFTEDRKFSSAFVLQGTVENATRSFFTNEVREAFLRFANTNTQVEAQGDSLIIHRGMALPPDDWAGLLKDTFAIYKVLKKQEGDLLD